MVHHRVADKDRVEDQRRVNPGLGRCVSEKLVHPFAHGPGHFRVAAGVHHRIGNTAHQVFAKADLRVHHARAGHHFAGAQAGQMRGDGGRSEVHRHAVKRPVIKVGPQANNRHSRVTGFGMQCAGDLPLSLAQHRLKISKKRLIQIDILKSPLLGQRRFQPLQIARGVVHIGLGNLDIGQPDRRAQRDVSRLDALADHLTVNLAFGRHVDHNIALNQRLAAQPAPLSQPPDPVVPGLDFVPVRQRMLGNRHAVLGKFTKRRGNLALRTDPAPPQTLSRSTPSWRAAVRIGVPGANRPRFPDGVKTTRGWSDMMPILEAVQLAAA